MLTNKVFGAFELIIIKRLGGRAVKYSFQLSTLLKRKDIYSRASETSLRQRSEKKEWQKVKF